MRASFFPVFSTEPAQLVSAESDEATELQKALEPCGLWSVPPTMMTMHLDNPERFFIVKGKVDITPVTLQVCIFGVGRGLQEW